MEEKRAGRKILRKSRVEKPEKTEQDREKKEQSLEKSKIRQEDRATASKIKRKVGMSSKISSVKRSDSSSSLLKGDTIRPKESFAKKVDRLEENPETIEEDAAKAAVEAIKLQMQEKAEKKLVKKTLKKYLVIFQDEAGNVLQTSFVTHGQTAIAPEVPLKKEVVDHYELIFEGWTGDFTFVTQNLVIKAVYKSVPKKYLILYFHENGKLLGMESVFYGDAAKADYHPIKESDEAYDYPFIGWDQDLSMIHCDLKVNAVFRSVRKLFAVAFFHENGSILKLDQIPYGESAIPPEEPEKKADPVYHYQFREWSQDFSYITKPLAVHARFDVSYNEYTAQFFDGDTLLEEKKYHYGDKLVYPSCHRRGYDLCWTDADSAPESFRGSMANPFEQGDESQHGTPTIITRDIHLTTKWSFHGKKGAILSCKSGEYEVLDPSITDGTVRCLRYDSRNQYKVCPPPEVKLGDYYYKVTEIGPYAFAGCKNVKRLILPDSIKSIGEHGLSGCKTLESITLGRNVREIKKYAFSENERLKQIVCKATSLKKIDKDAFKRLRRNVMLSCTEERLKGKLAPYLRNSKCDISLGSKKST